MHNLPWVMLRPRSSLLGLAAQSSPPPPSGNVMDEIEPNPRGITRSEVVLLR